MFSARTCVWESSQFVSEDGEAGAVSQKNIINVNTVLPDATVSVNFFSGAMHPAHLKRRVPEKGFENNLKADEVEPTEVDTAGEV